MRVLITGGSGMIGSALTKRLVQDGHQVTILTRQNVASTEQAARETAHVRKLQWDGQTSDGWGSEIDKIDAIVNLAGFSLSTWPWNNKNKRQFLESRVNSGEAITRALLSTKIRPRTLVQISGINYYGPTGSPVDETGDPGDDFLSRLSVKWEESTSSVESLGVRRCVLRLGVVLSRAGGLFSLMALPVRLFMGGPLGSGKQIVGWVHVQDVVESILFLLDNQGMKGAFNCVAPESITNEQFYRTLARRLNRPYWLRAPGIILRLVLGGISVLVLGGRVVKPHRLLEAGFKFTHRNLDAALSDLLAD